MRSGTSRRRGTSKGGMRSSQIPLSQIRFKRPARRTGVGIQRRPHHHSQARGNALRAVPARMAGTGHLPRLGLRAAGRPRGLEAAPPAGAHSVPRAAGLPRLRRRHADELSSAATAATCASASTETLNADLTYPHRLRAGGSRSGGRQPDAVQPVLPGEAAVLHRERRARSATAASATKGDRGGGSRRIPGCCRCSTAGPSA